MEGQNKPLALCSEFPGSLPAPQSLWSWGVWATKGKKKAQRAAGLSGFGHAQRELRGPDLAPPRPADIEVPSSWGSLNEGTELLAKTPGPLSGMTLVPTERPFGPMCQSGFSCHPSSPGQAPVFAN